MTDPKIDYEKILDIISESGSEEWSTEDMFDAMRQAAIEAIRLAAPLLLDNFDNWDDYFIMPTKQSILDAVDEVTKKIVGE